MSPRTQRGRRRCTCLPAGSLGRCSVLRSLVHQAAAPVRTVCIQQITRTGKIISHKRNSQQKLWRVVRSVPAAARPTNVAALHWVPRSTNGRLQARWRAIAGHQHLGADTRYIRDNGNDGVSALQATAGPATIGVSRRSPILAIMAAHANMFEKPILTKPRSTTCACARYSW